MFVDQRRASAHFRIVKAIRVFSGIEERGERLRKGVGLPLCVTEQQQQAAALGFIPITALIQRVECRLKQKHGIFEGQERLGTLPSAESRNPLRDRIRSQR